MSFKRVGDDPTALRIQKKQRVSNLLLEDIPEDEARLLKNGRFACVVCKHCPVFDTVAVLSIHRQGRKHLANAKVRLEKLREDAELRQKREHLQYLGKLEINSNEKEPPLLTITQRQTEFALRGSQNALMKRCAEQQRKPNLPFFQSKQPSNFLDTKTNTQSVHSPIFCGKRALSSNLMRSDTAGSKIEQAIGRPSTSERDASELHSGASDQLVQVSPGQCYSSNDQPRELSLEERARMEHFSRLRQAGWIMSSDGKWYKDENAEFDSDEEEPPPPP
ncbi:sodium channel modifier 1-like [Montipora capricornis]|uniref:sodium channel modifier 1-like n=1 Tax=Montipora capricornis TaxID=246305 RepID=UPI0035F1F222